MGGAMSPLVLVSLVLFVLMARKLVDIYFGWGTPSAKCLIDLG